MSNVTKTPPPDDGANNKKGKRTFAEAMAGGCASQALPQPFNLSVEPRSIMILSDQIDDVKLHYDKELGGYFQCCGDGCCFCFLNVNKVQKAVMVLALDVISGEIGSIKVSTEMGPYRLGGLLKPYLSASEGTPQQVLEITCDRNHGYKYTLVAIPLADDLDLDETTITAAVAKHEGGEINLADVYPMVTPEMQRQVEHIRRRLKLRGLLDENDNGFGRPKGV
jgi:hypothetical protein